MSMWLIIFGMAVVTYLPRVLPLIAIQEEALPTWARRGLVYVPIAVLSAIVGPAYIPSETWFVYTVDGRVVAGGIAVVTAWYSRNTAITIVVGMAVLLLLT